ncbi:MAG TPA: alpha/beta hydrolase, partial [Alphaproteobacteria bacterium]|nr:alpha/beta hydrolase [Alphaproteobacteria bacterium]
MSIEPVSIEVIAGDGLTLCGYEWPTRGAPVVLLHDHDDDLDAWHDLDGELATNGFRVI